MKTIITISFLLLINLLQAQTQIKNVSFTQQGNNIVVNYDLYGNKTINVQLFYTTNNGITWQGPLQSITGNVNRVQPGSNKTITWNVLKERSWLISDNIKFKVKAEPNKGTFTDTRDGDTYKWVRIGEQVWMVDNLRYAQGKYIISKSEWDNLEDNNYDAAYCWYDNNTSNKQKYGALYTYAAAKKACPTGWHLPSDNEWTKLENYIRNDGYSGNEGTALKATNDWNNNGNGTDNYGFTAFPGGYRNDYGSFYDIGTYGYWWSATERGRDYAYTRLLYYNYGEVSRNYRGKSYGFSVRCLRDN